MSSERRVDIETICRAVPSCFELHEQRFFVGYRNSKDGSQQKFHVVVREAGPDMPWRVSALRFAVMTERLKRAVTRQPR